METGRRELGFLLADPERRLLVAIAGRLPRWVLSDHLTALGMLGSVGAGVGYALSTAGAPWLWLASAMLAVQWLGDSLDGTLARVRRCERPRYGYYVDHLFDGFAAVVIGVGAGLSPYVDLDVALLCVVAYLALLMNVFLETNVFGVFRMAYGRLGSTELRIIIVLLNAALFILSGLDGLALEWVEIGTNALAIALAAGMFGLVAVRSAGNLRRLRELEARRRASGPESPEPEHQGPPALRLSGARSWA